MVVAIILLLAPSSVIYPGQPSAFKHAKHVKLPCAQCHAAVMTSTRAADRNLPANAVCAKCHNAPIPVTAPVGRPTSALVFNHSAHAKTPCATCHTDASLPTMATCLTCHSSAPDACATCHLARPDGYLRTRLPGGALRPRDHGPDFSKKHATRATAAAGECAVCHEPDDCAQCHQGVRKPIELHPADYILAHPADARRNALDCQSCHRAQTFCVNCHTRSGVVDAPNSPDDFGALQGLRKDFHPPGWNNPFGRATADHHRYAARRNLAECVSCHQESTCVRCHSADAPAMRRASPHPAGFARQCRRLRDAAEVSCLKCHTNRAELDRLCR